MARVLLHPAGKPGQRLNRCSPDQGLAGAAQLQCVFHQLPLLPRAHDRVNQNNQVKESDVIQGPGFHAVEHVPDVQGPGPELLLRPALSPQQVRCHDIDALGHCFARRLRTDWSMARRFVPGRSQARIRYRRGISFQESWTSSLARRSASVIACSSQLLLRPAGPGQILVIPAPGDGDPVCVFPVKPRYLLLELLEPVDALTLGRTDGADKLASGLVSAGGST